MSRSTTLIVWGIALAIATCAVAIFRIPAVVLLPLAVGAVASASFAWTLLSSPARLLRAYLAHQRHQSSAREPLLDVLDPFVCLRVLTHLPSPPLDGDHYPARLRAHRPVIVAARRLLERSPAGTAGALLREEVGERLERLLGLLRGREPEAWESLHREIHNRLYATTFVARLVRSTDARALLSAHWDQHVRARTVWLYHGTGSVLLESILQHGLDADRFAGDWSRHLSAVWQFRKVRNPSRVHVSFTPRVLDDAVTTGFPACLYEELDESWVRRERSDEDPRVSAETRAAWDFGARMRGENRSRLLRIRCDGELLELARVRNALSDFEAWLDTVVVPEVAGGNVLLARGSLLFHVLSPENAALRSIGASSALYQFEDLVLPFSVPPTHLENLGGLDSK